MERATGRLAAVGCGSTCTVDLVVAVLDATDKVSRRLWYVPPGVGLGAAAAVLAAAA